MAPSGQVAMPLLDVGARCSERGGGLHVQKSRAVRLDQKRRRVTGRGDPEVAACRVDAGDEQGGHALQLEVVPTLAQHLDEVPGSGGLTGQDPGGGPELAHDGGRRHVMTGHVADGDGDRRPMGP